MPANFVFKDPGIYINWLFTSTICINPCFLSSFFFCVGLFVDETLSCSVLEKTSTESFQALWIEISFVKNKNVICGVLYRQHNSPESFLKYLEETIDKFTSTEKNLCLLGDFNFCLQKIETCNYSRDFLLALQSCYLLPTIDKPTRVHKNSASLIDNIFVNNPEQVLISGNLITDVSDHFSQFCILTSSRHKIKRKRIKKLDLSHFNPDSLNSDLATIDWSCIIKTQANNVHELFSTFYRNFNKIINKHAPIKTLSRRRIKQFFKPWITKGIRTSIKKTNCTKLAIRKSINITEIKFAVLYVWVRNTITAPFLITI